MYELELSNILKSEYKRAIVIGKIDGFHKGHAELLRRAALYASFHDMKSCVLIMEPVNSERICDYESLRKIIPAETEIIVCKLTSEIASMEYETFIREILVDKLNIGFLACGKDFRFGHNREGNVDNLKEMSEKYGFEIEVVDDVCLDGKKVSSTEIRRLLKNGDKKTAERMLGHSI
ncbi:MAG: FAD synthetase family protein [Lachnospiraceae bacterium]|nr:FAD synthetase family protein [Lachnospiraceae bacterium]